MPHLRRMIGAAKRRLRREARRLRAWWLQHRQRLSEEVGYAEAFGAVLIATVDLFGNSYRVRYAIRELVRAYVALQRIFSPAVAEPDWAMET